RLEARVHYGAVLGERGRLDDLVVPGNGKLLLLLVDQDIEEGDEVLGVEARGRRREAPRDIRVADDRDAIDMRDFARLHALDIAAALDREVDDHRTGLHRLHHLGRD